MRLKRKIFQGCQSQHTAGGEQTRHYPGSPCTRARAGDIEKNSQEEGVGHNEVQLQPQLLQSVVEEDAKRGGEGREGENSERGGHQEEGDAQGIAEDEVQNQEDCTII